MLPVQGLGGKLQIAENQVGLCQHGIDGSRAAHARGIQGRVDALLPQPGEKLPGEGTLGQGFAAREGDAAAADVLSVAKDPGQGSFGGDLFPAAEFPGVRIVTVGTAQGAALQEEDTAQAGSVHRAHGLEGMDAPHGAYTVHGTTWRSGRYGR